MGYILLAFGLYLLFRFVTGFLIPVMRATSQMRRQFQQVKTEMESRQQNASGASPSQADIHQKPKYDMEGEYISFEEVKP